MEDFTGTLIDVRTREEYGNGNVPGSINIPLQEISFKIEEILTMKTPVIFFCASGMRSEQACRFFQAKGLDCINGGGWQEVYHKFYK